jgi:predicted deacylase
MLLNNMKKKEEKREIINKNQDIIKENKEFKFDISHIPNGSGGYISGNTTIFKKLPNNHITRQILKESTKGTPLLRFGSGSPKLMLIAGIHGNELPPQIAILHLIMKLEKLSFDELDKINGTIYIIPFSAPKATMNSSRLFNKSDLNRSAKIEGSVSNTILEKIKDLKIDSVADFHSTAPNSTPGKEGVFCTTKPSPESTLIAEYIVNGTKSEVLKSIHAGGTYKGAMEDESNIIGIPSVTCEVLSPNGVATKRACNRSFLQMKYYLSYFGISL